MPMMEIDLIYTIETTGNFMSCAVIYGGHDDRDKLLGPYPAKGAIGPLARDLHALLPQDFPSAKDAETRLTFTHFRNMAAHQNSFGTEYPMRGLTQ